MIAQVTHSYSLAEAARREVLEEASLAIRVLGLADVVDLIKGMGVRCAARGSGAGSLVNYLLGISGIDPLRHGLLMERFSMDPPAAFSVLRRLSQTSNVKVVEIARRLVEQRAEDSAGGGAGGEATPGTGTAGHLSSIAEQD